MRRSDFSEFTGKISSGAFSEHDAHFIITGDNEENRMFGIYGGRKRGQELHDESDEERHKRYDLDMDTNIVFTICNFSQHIVFWRWKIMRQKSELIRYIVDQARLSEYTNGGIQNATVWVQRELQPIVALEITDEVMEKIHKELQQHPDVLTVDRNGGWFTITARFIK